MGIVKGPRSSTAHAGRMFGSVITLVSSQEKEERPASARKDGQCRLYACNRRVDIDVKHCTRLVFDTRDP